MFRLTLALLFAMSAGVARAQPWLDQPGVAGSTVVALGEARIHLPPGEWRQVSESSSTAASKSNVTLFERIFIQSDGKRVVAIAYVRTNASPSPTRKGFMPDPSCFRDTVFLNASQDLYPGDWDCMIVNHEMMNWDGPLPTLWQQALDAATALGGMPHPMIYVALGKASPSRSGFAILQVWVNPSLAGFTSTANVAWAHSEWHKNNLTPDRVAFLKKLAAWGEAYRPIFRKSWE